MMISLFAGVKHAERRAESAADRAERLQDGDGTDECNCIRSASCRPLGRTASCQIRSLGIR